MPEYLSKLNPQQLEAATTLEGPLLILAGAGSGKTGTMTHRIAYMIKDQGVSPYSILAVTFTNKAATEMRDRVEALVGPAPGMWIQTFHSACLRILRMDADKIGYERNFVVYDPADQKALMKSIVKELQYDEKQYAPAYVLSEISDAKEKLLAITAELDKYSEPINPDYTEIDAEIEKLNGEKQKCGDYTKLAYTIHETVEKKKSLLNVYVKAQGAEVSNSLIDDRIAEAKSALKQYAQAKADAESMLYQIQLISQKKNELLSEQVNSHFTRVKFRLFVTQKNGEIKDDCTPLVLCSDGEYRDMTYSANTAAIVAAKLDICSGLQKFYGQNLPIWLDGAECLDEQNRKALKMDNQLILLCVSEDEKLVVKND